MSGENARNEEKSPAIPDRDDLVPAEAVQAVKSVEANEKSPESAAEREERRARARLEWEQEAEEERRWHEARYFKAKHMRSRGYGATHDTLAVFADFLIRSGRIPADAQRIRDAVMETAGGFYYLNCHCRRDVDELDWVKIMDTDLFPHGYFYTSEYVEVELAKGDVPYFDFGIPPSPKYLRWYDRYLELMEIACPIPSLSFTLDELPNVQPLWEGEPAPWASEGASGVMLARTHDFYWLLTAAAQRFGAGIVWTPPQQVAKILLELDARDRKHLNLDIFAPIAKARLSRRDGPNEEA
jgi:hypothetical protein